MYPVVKMSISVLKIKNITINLNTYKKMSGFSLTMQKNTLHLALQARPGLLIVYYMYTIVGYSPVSLACLIPV